MNGDGSGYYGEGAVYLAGGQSETRYFDDRRVETAVATAPNPWRMTGSVLSQKT
jgi:hypothetical protein